MDLLSRSQRDCRKGGYMCKEMLKGKHWRSQGKTCSRQPHRSVGESIPSSAASDASASNVPELGRLPDELPPLPKSGSLNSGAPLGVAWPVISTSSMEVDIAVDDFVKSWDEIVVGVASLMLVSSGMECSGNFLSGGDFSSASLASSRVLRCSNSTREERRSCSSCLEGSFRQKRRNCQLFCSVR